MGRERRKPESGLPRVEHLRAAPAAVRFLSAEPLLEDLGEFDLARISWVIVGGESGRGARPLKSEVTSVRDQCLANRIPFFFNHWGGVRKKVVGRTLDGRTYDEFPPVSPAPVTTRDARLEAIDGIRTSFAVR